MLTNISSFYDDVDLMGNEYDPHTTVSTSKKKKINPISDSWVWGDLDEDLSSLTSEKELDIVTREMFNHSW